MRTTRNLFRQTLLWVVLLAEVTATWAQTTVMTEDFSGTSNIFGVTSTELNVGSAAIYDSGLEGFGKVLAVCKSSAEAVIKGQNNQAVAIEGVVTVEWDAFHGYFGNSRTSTVSLINSEGKVIASYSYNSQSCQVSAATIGGESVPGFEGFGGTQNANGWGGNGKPYTASGNPHISVKLTARGGVEMCFMKNGAEVKTLRGSMGALKRDVAKMKVESSVDNADRCYAIDNIKVTTDVLEEDPDYIEPIVGAVIDGAEHLTFGPTPDEAFSNAYRVLITGADGTAISESTLSSKIKDFKVVWDIAGFKTINDTEGQYCDSYGTFSTNNSGQVSTTFDLRNVPMNFFGKMTATITYNGTTTVAEKFVTALGNLSSATGRLLPWSGYPVDFSDYPDALVGYQVVRDTYGSADDLIVGGWAVAGSDNHNATLMKDADGTKFVRTTSNALKKSHVLTQTFEWPANQLIFKTRLRFNSAGAVVTLTGGYPFWSSSRYTCPVTLSFDGSILSLNGTAVTNGEAAVQFTTGAWYDVVLSADKSTERCYAVVYGKDGKLLGQTGIVAWTEASSPTFFSIGLGNSNTGSIDLATCEAYQAVAEDGSYKLTADKTTLSIPQNESAHLTATISDPDGYAITGQATWGVVEENMQSAVVLTPDADDSHKATLTLTSVAEAGTVTVHVTIGGNTKTIELSLTTSDESVKFIQSSSNISIPMDADAISATTFSAIVIDGEGHDAGSAVTLSAYERDGVTPLLSSDAIRFDSAKGVLYITAAAQPTQIVIRATGKNSKGEELSKTVRVNIHGLKFDFGYDTEGGVADGYTVVGHSAADVYSDSRGYGIKSSNATVGGTASTTDATKDYLEGAFEFDFKATKGAFYTVEITYQGTLTTGYINSDLAGYELGSSATMTTATFTIPATTDVIDLRIADSGDAKARIAQITVTKQAKRQKRGKRVVHHIGDSTSANNGSWAYRLKNLIGGTYPKLAEYCDFHNDGAGGRNLSTYYTQGKLASVLRDIYPGDIVMFGNNGTNGMGSSFEADVNYYLDAAEALGAQVILNSYTPHGAVSNYASGYNASNHTFNSYRKDSYETVVRKVADQRAKSDPNYLGFVEIGKNADAAFNAFVADYSKNGYASADAAAQAIITCFTDHNHYSNGTLACDLMLGGYGNVEGIVAQLKEILQKAADYEPVTVSTVQWEEKTDTFYTLSGQRLTSKPRSGLYIKNGRKIIIK